jgi:hypothetical protein
MSCIAPRCTTPRELGAVFCGKHLAASAGQRGGWISAEKRRRARAAGGDAPLDASNIVRRLWIGSKPPLDRPLPDFDILVLCAREIQPERVGFQGKVIRVPLPDAILNDTEVRAALVGARSVARELAAGKRVLVTCQAGLNRSAFVAALALGMVSKMPAIDRVDLIRQRRAPGALHNSHFVELLHKFSRF